MDGYKIGYLTYIPVHLDSLSDMDIHVPKYGGVHYTIDTPNSFTSPGKYFIAKTEYRFDYERWGIFTKQDILYKINEIIDDLNEIKKKINNE